MKTKIFFEKPNGKRSVFLQDWPTSNWGRETANFFESETAGGWNPDADEALEILTFLKEPGRAKKAKAEITWLVKFQKGKVILTGGSFFSETETYEITWVKTGRRAYLSKAAHGAALKGRSASWKPKKDWGRGSQIARNLAKKNLFKK